MIKDIDSGGVVCNDESLFFIFIIFSILIFGGV